MAKLDLNPLHLFHHPKPTPAAGKSPADVTTPDSTSPPASLTEDPLGLNPLPHPKIDRYAEEILEPNDKPPAEVPPPTAAGVKEWNDIAARSEQALAKLQTDLAAMSAGEPGRTFHREGVAVNASYQSLPADQVDPRLPLAVRTALLSSGLKIDGDHAFARLSYGRGDDNRNGLQPDVRGLWVRLQTPTGVQDITGTNAEVPFFRRPEELIAFGEATTDLVKDLNAALGAPSPSTIEEAGKKLLTYAPALADKLIELMPEVYPKNDLTSKPRAITRATEMLLAVSKPGLPVHSLAETPFFSGAPMYLKGADGKTYAFKYSFRPVAEKELVPTADLLGELKKHPDTQYELCVQMYTDPVHTPIDDVAVKWDSPVIKIGDLHLATGGIGGPEQAALDAQVKNQGSSALNNMEGISPAGLNIARGRIYNSDTAKRHGCPFLNGNMGLFQAPPDPAAQPR
jgi:hypothetical protein